MRILVVSHGHPDFSKGGAEIASYSLYKGYEQSSRVDSVFYLARYGGNNLRYGAIRKYKGNEYLWSQRLIDIFHLKGESVYSLLYMFLPFLKAVNPDIIHIHPIF